MEDTKREHLSALFDGEIEFDEDTSLSGLSPHKDTQAQLERYSLIRGALNAPILVEGDEFLSRVRLALKDEPVVLAPERKKNKTYITLSLAASFLLFTVLVLTLSLNESSDSGFQSMAQAEPDEKAVIVYTQSPTSAASVVVHPKARLVTFGK